MKNTTIKSTLAMVLICLGSQSFPQATQSGGGAAGHNPNPNPPATHYVGWDENTIIPLEIRHDGTQNIDIFTGGIQRMSILGTNAGDNAGNIGIGIAIPQSLIHLDQPGNANLFLQFTNGNTGNGNNTSGFRMGLGFQAPTMVSDFTFRHFQVNPRIAIFSSDGNTHSLRLRMENHLIPGFNNHPVNRVKIVEEENHIGRIWIDQPPCDLLHLGHHWPPDNGGQRYWMDVGTSNNAWSDFLYTGMKDVDYVINTHPWSGHMNAVIAWGDNAVDIEGADDLSVIFSSLQNPANGDASTFHGIEIMRLTPWARVGIGNFTDPMNGLGSGIRPWRRLEI